MSQYETVLPEDLKVGDRVQANGALFKIVETGLSVPSFPGRTEMIEVECVDPWGTTFKTGFRKQLVRRPVGGTWMRQVAA